MLDLDKIWELGLDLDNNPIFYEYVWVLGCGPQVGPFPSRPILGSIRGEGTPPQTLAVIWEKKRVSSISSGCSRKAGEGQPPSLPLSPPPHVSMSLPPPPWRPPSLLAPAMDTSPSSPRHRRPQAAAAAALVRAPLPPPNRRGAFHLHLHLHLQPSSPAHSLCRSPTYFPNSTRHHPAIIHPPTPFPGGIILPLTELHSDSQTQPEILPDSPNLLPCLAELPPWTLPKIHLIPCRNQVANRPPPLQPAETILTSTKIIPSLAEFQPSSHRPLVLYPPMIHLPLFQWSSRFPSIVQLISLPSLSKFVPISPSTLGTAPLIEFAQTSRNANLHRVKFVSAKFDSLLRRSTIRDRRPAAEFSVVGVEFNPSRGRSPPHCFPEFAHLPRVSPSHALSSSPPHPTEFTPQESPSIVIALVDGQPNSRHPVEFMRRRPLHLPPVDFTSASREFGIVWRTGNPKDRSAVIHPTWVPSDVPRDRPGWSRQVDQRSSRRRPHFRFRPWVMPAPSPGRACTSSRFAAAGRSNTHSLRGSCTPSVFYLGAARSPCICNPRQPPHVSTRAANRSASLDCPRLGRIRTHCPCPRPFPGEPIAFDLLSACQATRPPSVTAHPPDSSSQWRGILGPMAPPTRRHFYRLPKSRTSDSPIRHDPPGLRPAG